jgi:hypothetical protein
MALSWNEIRSGAVDFSKAPALVKAHQELDKAVDLCYRPQPFPNETKRIEYLFVLNEKYTAGLFRKKG